MFLPVFSFGCEGFFRFSFSMDVIEKLSALKLSHKESSGINTSDLGLQANHAKLQHCLVGKVVSQKVINIDAFRRTMTRVWSFCCGITIDNIGENLFLINPQSVSRRDRILEESPWCFDGNLILLQPPTTSDMPEEMVFDEATFWVQFHHLPLGLRNDTVAHTLRSRLGTVLRIETNDMDECWGPFLRVWVKM